MTGKVIPIYAATGAAQNHPGRLSTGILPLDLALDGGLPLGSTVQITGKAHAGKTTLALQILGQAQQAGLAATYLCGTRLPPTAYLAACGIDVERLHVPAPDEITTLENALQAAMQTLAKGSAVVIDPLPAFPTRSEWEAEEYDSGRKYQRPAILDAFYAIASTYLRRNPQGLFVVVNQQRYTPGVFFGDPWESTCREVTDHFQVDVHLARIQALKEGSEVIGSRIEAKVRKNSGSTPFQKAEFSLLNHAGPDFYGNLFEVALAFDLVVKAEGGYFLDGDALGRSQTVARQRFAELYRDGRGAAIRAALPEPSAWPSRWHGEPDCEEETEKP
jgi:recombination protein RecA